MWCSTERADRARQSACGALLWVRAMGWLAGTSLAAPSLMPGMQVCRERWSQAGSAALPGLHRARSFSDVHTFSCCLEDYHLPIEMIK